VTELPGTELVLLRPSGLSILSFANAGLPRRDLAVDGPTSRRPRTSAASIAWAWSTGSSAPSRG
jgi:hypothetical protein